MKKTIFGIIGFILFSIIGLRFINDYHNEYYILLLLDIFAVISIYEIFGMSDLIEKLKDYINK